MKSGNFYETCVFFYENFFYWWRWHIYLDLNQIWTRSEKCAIGIEKIPQPPLSAIIWLPGEGSDYKWRFVFLQRVAMLTPVVCDIEYSINVILTVKSYHFILHNASCLEIKQSPYLCSSLLDFDLVCIMFTYIFCMIKCFINDWKKAYIFTFLFNVPNISNAHKHSSFVEVS